jgi:hypothetical protein
MEEQTKSVKARLRSEILKTPIGELRNLLSDTQIIIHTLDLQNEFKADSISQSKVLVEDIVKLYNTHKRHRKYYVLLGILIGVVLFGIITKISGT